SLKEVHVGEPISVHVARGEGEPSGQRSQLDGRTEYAVLLEPDLADALLDLDDVERAVAVQVDQLRVAPHRGPQAHRGRDVGEARAGVVLVQMEAVLPA